MTPSVFCHLHIQTPHTLKATTPQLQHPPKTTTTAPPPTDQAHTTEKLTVILRDARKLLGVLRSWDQFGNLVLSDAVERIFAGGMYADVARGVYLVRGENVMLMGEVVCFFSDIPLRCFSPSLMSGLESYPCWLSFFPIA